MWNRMPQHWRVLIVGFWACLLGAAFNFVMDDGLPPRKLPRLEAAAEAVELLGDEHSSIPTPATTIQTSATDFLPQGFHAQWESRTLDKGRITIQQLTHPFLLSQTQNHLGREYFDTAAQLFEQLKRQIPETSLAQKLEQLKIQAQVLGNTIEMASNWNYDGPPTSDFEHLQVRASILATLRPLHEGVILDRQVNQHGALLNISLLNPHPKAGSDLQAFLQTEQSLLNDKASRKYPQTIQLVQKQGQLLQALANNTRLHWGSTLYCAPTGCKPLALRFNAHVEQGLSDSQLALLF